MSQIVVAGQGLSKRFTLDRDKRSSIKETLVRGRSKRGEEFWALRDVDLAVERGTTFGLIGHNGSGKSTLLKLLAGIFRPTTGTVSVTGQVSALLELGAGFHGDLTGRENVYLNGAILGIPRKQINEAMDRIVEFSGIGDFIDSPVKIYSSGMYVRLGFSIAVTVDPEILIVDEIIAVGDEEFQRKCFDHLFEMRRRGTTIVLVSHSLGLMADLCDQALWLDHGRPQAMGEARGVVDQYLRSVNEREADHNAAVAAAAGTDEATSVGDAEMASGRRGSGEIRVTGLTLRDSDGTVVPFVAPGQACSIVLSYHATADINDAVFGLGFVHESGVTVAGPNSGDEDRSFAIARGNGEVEYRMPVMPLQPGTYLLSTAVVDRGHTYDFQDRVYEVRVRADTALAANGMVRFAGAWSSHQLDGRSVADPANLVTR